MSGGGARRRERLRLWLASLPESTFAVCPRCKRTLPIENFWHRKKGHPGKVCWDCLLKASDARLIAKGKRPPVNYQRYIRSAEWSRKREEYWFSGRPRECYVCGAPWSGFNGMELHHVTYERLGAEDLDDLVPLCPTPCHSHITERWKSVKRDRSMTLRELTDLVRSEIRKAGSVDSIRW